MNFESMIKMDSIMDFELMISSIVFINYIIGLTLSNKYIAKGPTSQQFDNNLLFMIFSMVFALPILEESFYRLALFKIIDDLNLYQYRREISALFFGISHSINKVVIGDKYMLLLYYQIYHTIFLGYFLAGFESFYLAVLFHCLYNTSIFIPYLYNKYIINNKQQNYLNDDVKDLDFKKCYAANTPIKLKRSHSLDLTRFIKSKINIGRYTVILPSEFKNEKLNKWNDDLRESFDKYEKIKINNYGNYGKHGFLINI